MVSIRLASVLAIATLMCSGFSNHSRTAIRSNAVAPYVEGYWRFTLLVFAALISTLGSSFPLVYAQTGGGDVFSSDSGNGKTWWDVKRRDYPACAGLVDRPEEMTNELYRLDAEAKQAVEP